MALTPLSGQAAPAARRLAEDFLLIHDADIQGELAHVEWRRDGTVSRIHGLCADSAFIPPMARPYHQPSRRPRSSIARHGVVEWSQNYARETPWVVGHFGALLSRFSWHPFCDDRPGRVLLPLEEAHRLLNGSAAMPKEALA
jgi:hypothetical protein